MSVQRRGDLIRDVMTPEPITVTPTMTIEQAERRMRDAGMTIGLGTDGTGDGFGAHQQIAYYGRCGFTTAEAIQAA